MAIIFPGELAAPLKPDLENAESFDNTVISGVAKYGVVDTSTTTITADQLSSISANLGSITAGTITGGTFKTSGSGARIEMNANDQVLRFYDSSNNLQLQLYDYTIASIKSLKFQSSSSDPDSNLEMVVRSSGDNRYLRMKLGSTVEQFDTHSV